MNREILKDSYLVINFAFIGIILAVIAYSLIFSAEGNVHPLPSGSVLVSGQASASSGMSRSFSEIVRFNFAKARLYNPYGLRIFSFFGLQLLLRGGAVFLAMNLGVIQRRFLLLSDAILSGGLFIVFFWPFIVLTAQQLW